MDATSAKNDWSTGMMTNQFPSPQGYQTSQGRNGHFGIGFGQNEGEMNAEAGLEVFQYFYLLQHVVCVPGICFNCISHY